MYYDGEWESGKLYEADDTSTPYVCYTDGPEGYKYFFLARDRYDGTVSASVVRDFRGAMMGRADKGLIITTGIFSGEAVKESTRDGATPIDLIDGNDLAKHLKELRLGVKVKKVEKVIIDEEWFKDI